MMFTILLITHVAAGFNSLITGLIAMRAKKGSKLHLQMGRIYYYSMLFVVISVIPMQFFKLNIFLLLIALFSFYFVYMGKIVLKYKQIETVNRQDLKLILTFIILGVGMVAYGLFGSLLKEVMLIFGLIAVAQGIADWRHYKKADKEKNWWLAEHINKIGGSYIAATTAFVVQNAYRVIDGASLYIHILIWIGPAVLGSFFIARAIKRYSPKPGIKKATKYQQLEQI